MANELASPGEVANGAPKRGRLKIFLGMVAGVGKTYRMLQDGHTEMAAGRDVVVGLLETHGRADTARLAEGLEVLPRRTSTYREARFEELDVEALLRRAPDLALIDELAHTNAPGSPHLKRYEDVEEILAAGIDVLSTLNVQHLESLNDTIAELSGVRVRETIPDSMVFQADDVVIIDVSPETLLDRLREGKIYPAERIEAALNNFFRIENLSALREVALRQVAEQVESKRLVTERLGTREDTLALDAPQAVGERLLALVEPYPGAQRLVRRAWRSAQRLSAPLDLLWVRPPSRALRDDEERSLRALRELAGLLGANLIVEESDDLPGQIADVIRRRGSTYVLMGRARPARGLGRVRTPLPQKLMELVPGVDVRIVADRAKRQSTEEK